MARKLAAVVMSAFKRRHLLERSLECYRRQDFDGDRFQLVVVEDHGNDGTREMVLDWGATTRVDTTVLTIAPKPAEWTDCGWCLNAGIRVTNADHVILTHPEVMPGRLSVHAVVTRLAAFERDFRPHHPEAVGLYACCPVYYMGPRDQERIDTVDWRGRGAGAVRGIEGFYDEDENGHPDYKHKVTDQVGTPGFRIPTWESFVFAGHSRETWRRLGGMMETQKWGAVDVAWLARRRALGIPNLTCTGENCVVVHQWHGGGSDVPTDRNEQGWKDELAGVNWTDKASLWYPAIDNLGW